MIHSLKLLVMFVLTSVASVATAHEGHGGGSLVQHALEHGYMLIPAVFIVLAVLYFALKPVLSKKRARSSR